MFREAELLEATVTALKKLCKERKLKVSGKKGDLIRRLMEFSDALDQTQDESRETELYTQAQRELHNLSMTDLRDLCQERSLSIKGTKVDLVKRLASHQAVKDSESAAPQREQRAPKTVEDRFVQALRSEDGDLGKAIQDALDIEMPKPGDIVSGVVTSIVEWGAFVELDDTGWTGLVHVSEVSDVFIENIEEYLCPGQRVEALVLQSPIVRSDRLSLSIRRLKDLKRYDPEAVAKVGTLTPMARPNVVREEEFEALQERVAALEAIVIEMGHGQALREARSDVGASTRRSRVAPLSEMLNDINEEPKIPQSSAVKHEKAAIDKVIESLLEGSENSDANIGVEVEKA